MVLVPLAAVVAGSCAPSPSSGGATGPASAAVTNTLACDGAGRTGLVPRFCVNLPPAPTPAPITVEQAVAVCAPGAVPTGCEDINLPVLRASGAGTAPAPGGNLVCGEAGIASVTPRFCLPSPLQHAVPGASVRSRSSLSAPQGCRSSRRGARARSCSSMGL